MNDAIEAVIMSGNLLIEQQSSISEAQQVSIAIDVISLLHETFLFMYLKKGLQETL